MLIGSFLPGHLVLWVPLRKQADPVIEPSFHFIYGFEFCIHFKRHCRCQYKSLSKTKREHEVWYGGGLGPSTCGTMSSRVVHDIPNPWANNDGSSTQDKSGPADGDGGRNILQYRVGLRGKGKNSIFTEESESMSYL